MILSPYERSKQSFDEFIEDATDRLKLIIDETIEIIYDKRYIHFNDIASIGYRSESLVPELFIKKPLSNEHPIKVCKKLLDHYEELCDIFKEYTLRFNHIINYYPKVDSNNELYKIYNEIFSNLTKYSPEKLDDAVHFVKILDGKKLYVKTNYGSSKKQSVDMTYYLEDDVINTTSVPKTEFVSIISHLLATNVMPFRLS